jgi:hypothetical protein
VVDQSITSSPLFATTRHQLARHKRGTTRYKPKAKPVKDFSMRFPYDPESPVIGLYPRFLL